MPARDTFFSCDWGTTSFRLREVDRGSGQVQQELREASGAKSLVEQCREGDAACREQVFAEFLQDRLQRILPPPTARHSAPSIRVMISGMASSSVGWKEIPYASGPMALDGSTIRAEIIWLPLSGKRQAEVHLVSGVAFGDEMMRGEETELLGLFAEGRHSPFLECSRVVLPGTHSKHARIEGGSVVGLRTFMTGELFDVLSSHSLLRASVTRAAGGEGGGSLEDSNCRRAFLEGVDASVASGLAASLFQTRCRTVLRRVPPKENRWFLSGLLIGSELEGLRADPAGRPILIAATEVVSVAYRAALERLGLLSRTTVVAPDEMALSSVRGHQVLMNRSVDASAT